MTVSAIRHQMINPEAVTNFNPLPKDKAKRAEEQEKRMKEDMKDYLREHRVPFHESLNSAEEWREIASHADILYITQIPRDRFGDRVGDYEESKEIFRVSPGILKGLKKDTYILHPFPRDYEHPPEVDPDPRAVYFDMIKYGQFLRMGLLCLVLKAPLG